MPADHLVVSRAALHELLTDAHVAIVEHRHDWAGAVLHTLRKLTAPEAAHPQGRAVRLKDEGLVAGGDNAGPGRTPRGTPPAEAPAVPEAGTPAPPTIDLPDGLGSGDAPSDAAALPQAPASKPAQAAGGEPRARSKSVTPNRGSAGGVWTPERDALLRRIWHEGATAAEAFEQLNALPAEIPIASVQAVYNRAHGLKLRRPPEVAAQLMKRAGRMGAERAAQLAAAGVSTPGARPLVWTGERMDLAKQLWEAGESAEEILPRLNALPAIAEITNAHVIRTQASKHRWQRPAAFLEAKRAKYAAAMKARRMAAHNTQAEPAPEPPAESPPELEPQAPSGANEPAAPDAPPSRVSAAPPAPLAPADEKAEVFDAFASGMTVRDVAAEFGLPLSVLANWHAEWKLRARDAAA